MPGVRNPDLGADPEQVRSDVGDAPGTDFERAAALREGESACFSWIVWPDIATHDGCGASIKTDPRWAELGMPFDGRHMVWDSFLPVFEGAASPAARAPLRPQGETP